MAKKLLGCCQVKRYPTILGKQGEGPSTDVILATMVGYSPRGSWPAYRTDRDNRLGHVLAGVTARAADGRDQWIGTGM